MKQVLIILVQSISLGSVMRASAGTYIDPIQAGNTTSVATLMDVQILLGATSVMEERNIVR